MFLFRYTGLRVTWTARVTRVREIWNSSDGKDSATWIGNAMSTDSRERSGEKVCLFTVSSSTVLVQEQLLPMYLHFVTLCNGAKTPLTW